MKRIGLLLVGLLMLPTLCQAGNSDCLDSLKTQADKAFAAEQYEQAAKLYHQIADSVASVSVYLISDVHTTEWTIWPRAYYGLSVLSSSIRQTTT